jgi:hypothetical protein
MNSDVDELTKTVWKQIVSDEQVTWKGPDAASSDFW